MHTHHRRLPGNRFNRPRILKTGVAFRIGGLRLLSGTYSVITALSSITIEIASISPFHIYAMTFQNRTERNFQIRRFRYFQSYRDNFDCSPNGPTFAGLVSIRPGVSVSLTLSDILIPHGVSRRVYVLCEFNLDKSRNLTPLPLSNILIPHGMNSALSALLFLTLQGPYR
jgi:hypothetical protein